MLKPRKRTKLSARSAREGQQLVTVYFPRAQFKAMKSAYGERGVSGRIRQLVATDLAAQRDKATT